MNKAYIITNPCSGKSTFIDPHKKRYKDLHLLDHDYASYSFDTIKGLPEYSCILGRNHTPKLEECIYAIVLLDKDQLYKRFTQRKRNDSENGWVDDLVMDHPEQGYHAVQRTAKKYNIPVFSTFEDALDYIIGKLPAQGPTIKKLTDFDIQAIYDNYVVVNDNPGYLNKYVPLPIRKNNRRAWMWNNKDFPRVIALLEFRQFMLIYNRVFNDVLTFGSISADGVKDPELLYLKYKNHTDINHDIDSNHDLHFLKLEKKDYDFVMLNQLIEHLYNPILALHNIYQHMKVGGMIYVNVPVNNIPHTTPFHHYTGVTPTGLGAMMESAGFEILRIGQWGNKEYFMKLFDSLNWPDYKYSEEPGKNDMAYPVMTWCLAIKIKEN
jgi:SAM-dependent methyltransferase